MGLGQLAKFLVKKPFGQKADVIDVVSLVVGGCRVGGDIGKEAYQSMAQLCGWSASQELVTSRKGTYVLHDFGVSSPQ